jgi:hypothetical protein
VARVSATEAAYAPFLQELRELCPPGTSILDAHTHLGADEDGQRLEPDELLRALDVVSPEARACAFPFHDPQRSPAYRLPNDRVLDWASESDRIIPYCRLDPAEDPVEEAERCLARGARGIKLHPRAQAFTFDSPEMEAIFATARAAQVPILIHAGRGMAPMDALADIALRYPEVPLVLAHAAIAGQGMFAERLAEHPAVVYDTSCFSPFDVVELFARVPAERIVFASDVPYGRPANGLFMAMRAAAYAGLDDDERALVAGGTMESILDGGPLPETRPPRLDAARAGNGRLLRVVPYLSMAFGAVLGGGDTIDYARAAPFVAMARTVPRDPAQGAAGPALERIDAALQAAEQMLAEGGPQARAALGLVHGAAVIAATEPVTY